MNKEHMLRKNKDFSYCYRRGKKYATSYFTMYYVPSKYNVRVGFSVSKKVGKSVQRNKIRRRMKEAFWKIMPGIQKSCSIIFVAKPESRQASYANLLAAMETAIRKSGLP